jgi:FKBP-type peptidyl-prolyl cis-trans isomerase (trigger factor)
MAEIYTNIKSEKKENSEVEVTGEITVEALNDYRKKALKEIGKSITVDGFRQGHVPEKIIVEKVGEAYLLEEAAELALKEIGPKIIEQEAPNYVGRPNIEITKLAADNPVGFKITIGILPEFKLPDYKKIAHKEMKKEGETAEISEKEIDDVIDEVRKQRAHHAFHAANKETPGHDHAEEALAAHMPEFNDEFVKTLGAFESVADFREKAKGNMQKEKEHKNIEKRRGMLLEEIVKETDIKLPKAIIDAELERMFGQFEADISGMGLKVEDYLKHIKKTPEELRTDWLPDAEKRAKLNLILAEIAKTESIHADKDAVELEVKNLTEKFKDVDPLRVRAYVEHSLTIEKVIQFLESHA